MLAASPRNRCAILLLGMARFGQRRKMQRPRLLPSSAFQVLMVGYAAVALFLMVFWIARSLLGEEESSSAFVLAAAAAAPLVLALVWDRLRGIKIFGVEFDLKAAEAKLDEEVAVAVQLQESSATPELVEGLAVALSGPRPDGIKVNLGDGSFWWSTRLLLLASLVDDFDATSYLVFTDSDDRYVGSVEPRAVRRAFGAVDTFSVETYHKLLSAPAPDLTDVERIRQIAWGWPYGFDAAPVLPGRQAISEEDKHLSAENRYKRYVTRTMVQELLGEALFKDALEWNGRTLTSAEQLAIVGRQSPVVALELGDQFDRLVIRCQVAQRIIMSA
jgi:hypothetical protein